jgi:hypothetical protein
MFILLYVASGPVKYEYCTCVYPPDQVGTKLKLSTEKDRSFKRAFSGKVGENLYYTHFLGTANCLILKYILV